MSVQTVENLAQLKSLTLLETAELVKQIEDTFNVDASRPQVNLPLLIDPIQNENPIQIQQIELDLILEEVPPNKKIAILKIIRKIKSLALKEAKDFVENLPQTVKTGIAIAEAEEIKQQLEAAEAKVSFK